MVGNLVAKDVPVSLTEVNLQANLLDAADGAL